MFTETWNSFNFTYFKYEVTLQFIFQQYTHTLVRLLLPDNSITKVDCLEKLTSSFWFPGVEVIITAIYFQKLTVHQKQKLPQQFLVSWSGSNNRSKVSEMPLRCLVAQSKFIEAKWASQLSIKTNITFILFKNNYHLSFSNRNHRCIYP